MSELTVKQSRFVEEYLTDFDATNAAKRSGYSAQSASVIGCENLTKPNIKQAIQKRLQELSDASIINRDAVVMGLLREANDRSPGSTQAARISAWDKLAKIHGCYQDEPLVNLSLESDINHQFKQILEGIGDEMKSPLPSIQCAP